MDLILSDFSSVSLPSHLSALDTGPPLASHSRRNTHVIQGMYCGSRWNLVLTLLSLQRNLTHVPIARPCLHTALNVCLLPLTSVEPLILVVSQSKESYRQGSPETLDLKPSYPKEYFLLLSSLTLSLLFRAIPAFPASPSGGRVRRHTYFIPVFLTTLGKGKV